MTIDTTCQAPITFNTDGIPQELKDRPQWVLTKGGKAGSPINPHTLTNGSSTDPSKWDTYETCLKIRDAFPGKFPFLGFVFTASDPYVGIDLDGAIDPETGDLTNEARAIIDALDSYTEISPSGTGFHILAKGVIPKASVRKGVEIYTAGRYFRMTGNHYEGTPLEVLQRTKEIVALLPYATPASERSPLDDPPDTIDEGLRLMPGERNMGMMSLAGALRRKGTSLKQMVPTLMELHTQVCPIPMDTEEVNKIAAQACSYKPADLTKPLVAIIADGLRKKQIRDEKQKKMEAEGWAVNSKCELLNTQMNVVLLLRKAVARDELDIYYDSWAQQIVLDEKPISDVEVLHVWGTVQLQEKNTVWSKSHIWDAIEVIAHDREVDPLINYLKECHQKWDQEPRIRSLLSDVWGVEKTEYHAAAMRAWMIQAVARGMNTNPEGVKCDLTLLLLGKQGVGKSLFFQRICPNPRWFVDSIPALDNKEAPGLLQGKWIVELAELSAVRKSQIEAVRGFLSRVSDTYRPPYGRVPIERVRRCVFGGTANELFRLPDQEGNRRFLPIIVGETYAKEVTEDVRDQLWGEAMEALKQGEQPNIPRHLWGEAEEAQSQVRDADELEGELGEILSAAGSEGITIFECMQEMGWETTEMKKGDQMRFAAMLRNLGCERKRISIDGKRPVVWKKRSAATH